MLCSAMQLLNISSLCAISMLQYGFSPYISKAFLLKLAIFEYILFIWNCFSIIAVKGLHTSIRILDGTDISLRFFSVGRVTLYHQWKFASAFSWRQQALWVFCGLFLFSLVVLTRTPFLSKVSTFSVIVCPYNYLANCYCRLSVVVWF